MGKKRHASTNVSGGGEAACPGDARSPAPAGYAWLLKDIKARIQQSRTRAIFSLNAEMTRLYWDIGRMIDERQQREGWGAAVIPRLARELHNELPEEKGYSERNIKRMLAFYRSYRDPAAIVPQAVAQLATAQKVPRAVAPMSPPADSLLCYCNVVNATLRHMTDQPTIGLILCQSKERLLAEYALSGIDKPIGVSRYELTRALPGSLQSALPTVEQSEAELDDPKAGTKAVSGVAASGRKSQTKKKPRTPAAKKRPRG
jgi:DUF1016 N-terminal domain/YhcG PDDEXK nuclease domain